MSDQSLTLQCNCNWLDHQFRITLMEDDGTAAIEMIIPRRTLLERIRLAFRYIFGADRSICDVVLTKDQVTILRKFLFTYEHIDWKGSYLEQRKREAERCGC